MFACLAQLVVTLPRVPSEDKCSLALVLDSFIPYCPRGPAAMMPRGHGAAKNRHKRPYSPPIPHNFSPYPAPFFNWYLFVCLFLFKRALNLITMVRCPRLCRPPPLWPHTYSQSPPSLPVRSRSPAPRAGITTSSPRPLTQQSYVHSGWTHIKHTTHRDMNSSVSSSQLPPFTSWICICTRKSQATPQPIRRCS